MAVIAPNVLDAVDHAGGWLFDRIMAGWEVTVMVVDLTDPRPAHILGAMVLDLEQSLTSPPSPSGARPHEIAVSGTVFESDPRIHEGISANIRYRSCRITMWGKGFPDDLDEYTSQVEHRPSNLARAFKAQAMAAAAAPSDQPGAVEVFRRAGIRDGLFEDLVPAGSR